MKKMKNFTLILFSLIFMSGCANITINPQQRFINTAVDVGFNDAPVTFIAYFDNQSKFDESFALLRQELKNYGLLFDKYNLHSNLTNLKSVNDNAGKGPIVVDQALIDLMIYSRKWHQLSRETFDITLGAVLNVWHLYRTEGRELNAQTPRQNGRIPSLDELLIAHECSGWDHVLVDTTLKSIDIVNPCTQLDVGGIAKGFAVDRVVDTLIAQGLTTAIINLGDSSIVTIGEKPDGTDWGIGISQPKRNALFSDPSVESLFFKGYMAISTSGDYQNFYLAEDGNYYAHIIDPNTLFPVRTHLRSVTVASDLGASAAEALSKALFILEYEEALDYLSFIQSTFPTNFIGAVWVYDLNQAPLGATSIESQGFSVVHTENIKPYSRLNR
jgi:FAD:protein FMN transferase